MFGHFEENIARSWREKERGINADCAWPVGGRNKRQVTGSNELRAANSNAIRPLSSRSKSHNTSMRDLPHRTYRYQHIIRCSSCNTCLRQNFGSRALKIFQYNGSHLDCSFPHPPTVVLHFVVTLVIMVFVAIAAAIAVRGDGSIAFRTAMRARIRRCQA